MPSAEDFATRALRLIGIIDPTENPSAEDGETALQVLNDWIDDLGTQRQSIYALARTTQTLISGTASYTIGSGGTINIVRPLWIDHAGFVFDTTVTPSSEVPVHVLQNDEYEALTPKALQSSVVSAIWYDHAWTAGLGRIYVFPIPNVGSTQLVLYTPTALTEFANYATDYTFPPGYRRAITYNLAVELAAHFPGALVPPKVEQLAASSLANLKRANLRLSTVDVDHALSGRRLMSASRFAGGHF